MAWTPELEELARRTAMAEAMGGADKVKRQHDAGRLTVRERIQRLLDDGSFHEVGALSGVADYDAHGTYSLSKGGSLRISTASKSDSARVSASLASYQS